jgi:hypothetical protein
MEIPRCTAIGFLVNLQNNTFKEIYVLDEKKMEEEASKDKPIPTPMLTEDKHFFLEKIKINVPAEERGTDEFLC